MASEIVIDGKSVGAKNPPFIIAEMSANHNGSLEAALRLIKAAKASGVDAIKIQTYTPDTITLKCDLPHFQINEGLWAGRTLYDLYQWAHTPWEWHKPMFDYAREIGITIFSSPFDKSAVDLLEDLNVPAYKIASFEAIDLPLIKYAASTGKPLIISTGMASLDEIKEAVDAARGAGCRQLAILHCVSGYPAPAEDYNLLTISDMIERFGIVTGLSDHTLDKATAIASVALGASIIEKHFTLDRTANGPDDSFSIEPIEMRALCESARTAWRALGSVSYERKSSEKTSAIFRRSLYFVVDVQAGDEINESNVRSIRPGYGLPPKYFEEILGRKAIRDISKGTPVSWELMK